MKYAGIFAIIVGAMMIGQWSVLFAGGAIPELKTEPIRIWFHIAAELITAGSLIVSGTAVLRKRSWAKSIYCTAIGMLIYTSIVSPGYFAQNGEWLWLLLFSVLIVGGILGAQMITHD